MGTSEATTINYFIYIFCLVLLRTLQEENKFLLQKVQTLESELKWYRVPLTLLEFVWFFVRDQS